MAHNKHTTSSMNQEEDNSVIVEFNTDDRVDDITENVESHTGNITETNVNASKNTDSVEAYYENSAKDVTEDNDNDDMLVKSEVILNPIREEVKFEELENDSIEYKPDMVDFDDKSDIIHIVHHNIKDEDSDQ